MAEIADAAPAPAATDDAGAVAPLPEDAGILPASAADADLLADAPAPPDDDTQGLPGPGAGDFADPAPRPPPDALEQALAPAAPRPDLNDLWIVQIRLRGRSVLADDVFALGSGEAPDAAPAPADPGPPPLDASVAGDAPGPGPGPAPSGEGELWLPAGELFSAMEFPIEYDAATGLLEGWFLREGQDFRFSRDTLGGTVAGRAVSLPPGTAIEDGGDLYLPLSALSDWLQLGGAWSRSDQSVSLEPAYLLPAEERAAREAAAGTGGGGGPVLDVAALPRAQERYGWIGWPHAELSLSATADQQFGDGGEGGGGGGGLGGGNGRGDLQGSVVLRGDLLKTSATLFAAASSRDAGQGANARLTLARQDPDSRLLGPLRASTVEAGDIALSPVPLLQRASSGAGLRIARAPPGEGEAFDTYLFEGTALPGWQAELYRDTELLGFQTVGGEGRYAFAGIPLVFGENRLRVELYGPEGQRETVQRPIRVDGSLVRPGALDYSLELLDADRVLLGGLGDRLGRGRFDPVPDPVPGGVTVEDGTVLTPEEESRRAVDGAQGGRRAQLRVGYGLRKDTTLRATLAWQDVPGAGASVLAGGGASWSGLGWLAEADALAAGDGGVGWSAGAGGNAGPLSLTARHEQFTEDFSSSANRAFGGGAPIRSRTTLSATGRATLGPDIPVSAGLSAARAARFDGGRADTAALRLSASSRGLSVTQSVGWQDFATGRGDAVAGMGGDAGRSRVFGATGFSGGAGRLRLRAGLDYDLSPEPELRRATASAGLRAGGWALDGRWSRDFAQGGNEIGLGASRDFSGIRLGAEARWNDRSERGELLATLSASVDRDPATGALRFGERARRGRGTVRVAAFEDLDGDGRRGAEEPLLGIASALAEPRGRATALPDGRVLLEDLPAGQRSGMALDADGFDDPFLIAASEGAAVVARPGAVTDVFLPVVQSAEAELLVVDADGAPLEGVKAELIPCEGEGESGGAATRPNVRTRSAFDGLVLFQFVRPGCYRLEVDGTPRARLELAPGEIRELPPERVGEILVAERGAAGQDGATARRPPAGAAGPMGASVR